MELTMAESYEDAVRYKAVESFKAGEFDKAIEHFDELVELSQHPWDHLWRGKTLYLLGRYADACNSYELVLQLIPGDCSAMYHLAHIKASCENPALRDGKSAVDLATRVCEVSEWKNWVDVTVLAAAYAETANWEQAERYASIALELAPDDEKDRRKQRLDQYRRHQPFRSSPEINHSLLVRNKRN
jgi:tetratricopeptide (TPR) repeat protein